MSERQEYQGDNDFRSYRLLIIHEMNNLQTSIKEIDRKIDDLIHNEIRKIWIEVSYLKIKAGVWGGLGGLIPLIIAIVIAWLSSKMSGTGGKP